MEVALIVGNGMLATAFIEFIDNPDVIIFASGVSNSLETDKAKFLRETNLLKKYIVEFPDKLLVYFSTCSMYDPVAKFSDYVIHKIAMEDLIKTNCKDYLIFRVSQILGKSNNQTLINFLFDNIINGKYFEIWHKSNRNLIALNDVLKLTHLIIKDKLNYNKVYHLATPNFISIQKLVSLIEAIVSKKSNAKILDKGSSYEYIPYDIDTFVKKLGINFDDSYYLRNLTEFYLKLND